MNITEPNNRTRYVNADGTLTNAGLMLLKDLWNRSGAYEPSTPGEIEGRVQMYAELIQSPQVTVIVTAGDYLTATKTAAGYELRLNLSEVVLAVLNSIPTRPEPKLPAYDAQPILAAAFYGV